MRASSRLGSAFLRTAKTSCHLQCSKLPPVTCSKTFCSEAASVNGLRSPSVVWLCSSTNSSPLQSVDKPAPVPPTRQVTPKEVLLQVDYIIENTLRFFFQNASKAPPVDSLVVKDVEFEDRIYGYSFKGNSNLRRHIAKMKIYLRYKSAFNRVDHLGSAIYENEDVIVTLYKWKFMESHWASLKTLLQRPVYGTKEAVLDLHVNPEGKIYKIVNREATEQDRTDVANMNQIKAERAEAEEREKNKRAEEQWQKENEGLDNPYRPS